MSLSVPLERLAQLPELLGNVSRRSVRQMRDELYRWRRALWYGSIYGECGLGPDEPEARRAPGPPVPHDAFDGLMRVLAARLHTHSSSASSARYAI